MKSSIKGLEDKGKGISYRAKRLEDKMVEITAEEQNKEEKRMKRIEDNPRDLWDNTNQTNVRIIGVPEREEKKEGSEKLFEEIIVKNFPNMGKEIVDQVLEAQRVPYRINPRRNTPRDRKSTRLNSSH